MTAPATPRQALQDLVDFFEVIEKCGACIPLSKGRGIFVCHQARWEKLLREAREALRTSLS